MNKQHFLFTLFIFDLFRIMHSLVLFWYGHYIYINIFDYRSLLICDILHSWFADLFCELSALFFNVFSIISLLDDFRFVISISVQ